MSQAIPADCLKTTSLRLFIASIITTAVVGAAALIVEPAGWWFLLQIKILATSSILAGASVCGLVCGGCYALGRKTLPTVGMALVGVAACSGLTILWLELGGDFEWLFKITSVAATLGIACSHLAMLLLMKLHRSYAWVHGLAYFLVLGLGAFVSLLIVTDGGFNEMLSIRLVGMMSIAATAVSLIIPVLSYLSRGKDDETGETSATLQGRIARLREELAGLEARLEELPPPAPRSPWDAQPGVGGPGVAG